ASDPAGISPLSLHDALPISKYHNKVTSAYPSCPRVCSVRAPKKPKCSVKVGGTQLEALIDTGSDVTLFPEAVVQADAPVREFARSEEHTSELQSRFDLVCRL